MTDNTDKIVQILNNWYAERQKDSFNDTAEGIGIGELAEQLKALQSGWISVEDRLPLDRNVYNKDKAYREFLVANFNEFRPSVWVAVLHDRSGVQGEITHWMPLPEPPEDK